MRSRGGGRGRSDTPRAATDGSKVGWRYMTCVHSGRDSCRGVHSLRVGGCVCLFLCMCLCMCARMLVADVRRTSTEVVISYELTEEAS